MTGARVTYAGLGASPQTPGIFPERGNLEGVAC